MKRYFLLLSSLFFSLLISAQDTTIVQTFTLDSEFREAMFSFPDEPGTTYEKIIMQYRMRCHDAAVGNGNVGCREWDYHCNTVVTDSSRTDSVWATHPNYVVTGSSSNPFYYVTSPTYNYLLYTQQEVTYTNIISEDSALIGTGVLELDFPFDTDYSTGKTQVLYTAAELSSGGLLAGDVTGLRLFIDDAGNDVDFLKIKIKHSAKTELDNLSPDVDGFDEVYFLNTNLENSAKRSFNFYNPFTWNGTDNLLIEFSFTLESAGSTNTVSGHETTPTTTISSNSPDGFVSINQGDYISVPAEAFNDVDSIITLAFWQYGDPNFQPFNCYIFEGGDVNNNRVINSHLPWSNSSVYWDAGNSGTNAYDRIDKEANFEDFAGKWNHWAFTKNAITGDMKMYLNGELWHSGTGFTRSMNGITTFNIGGNKNNGQYAGYINDFAVWKSELNEQTIHDWMFKDIDNSHPDFSDLLFYYKLDESDNALVEDFSGNDHDGTVHGQPLFINVKGHQLNRNFTSFQNRPNIEFVQGSYIQTIETTDYLDSLQRPNNSVYSYYVDNNNLIPNDTNIYWEAGYMPVINEVNEVVDSIYIAHEDLIDIETLEYYQKWPSRYELLSFITPYGNGLDLGEEGKMWEFDVTDFTPVLKGDKFLSIEGVGKWSEEYDIRFLFIEGTPVRDILDVSQIWPIAKAGQLWYSTSPAAIINDERFEPRDVTIHPDASFVKVRSAITGHGQTGEFVPKWHWIDVDGDDKEYQYKVWKECSTVPIYPQGGTWPFDRAGWCPGDPTNVYEFDISPFVTPGQTHTIDYGLLAQNPFANADYRISNQMVTYGPANFTTDVAIKGVRNPNNVIAAHERFNPACMAPQVLFTNTGSGNIYSIQFEYYVEDGEVQTDFWTGNIAFLDSVLYELPIPNYSFWMGSENIFHINILNVNGAADENPNNNSYSVSFETTDLFDIDEEIELHCMTNNYGHQNSYYIVDSEGNIILEKDDFEDNTLYTDVLDLAPGCYKLRIDDTGDDGLYYWYNTNQGSGYLRLKNSAGYILENFEPEFGRFAEYEFAIVDLTGNSEIKENKICSIYPNPTSSTLFIEMNGYEKSSVRISLYNSSMSLISDMEFSISNNTFNKGIDVSNLSPGVYIAQIIIDNKITVHKVVIK